MNKRIMLATPHMSDEGYELEYIRDAFEKNWIAPLGENVTGFERDIAAYTGAEQTVALALEHDSKNEKKIRGKYRRWRIIY